jgi:PAS domain-containing protein
VSNVSVAYSDEPAPVCASQGETVSGTATHHLGLGRVLSAALRLGEGEAGGILTLQDEVFQPLVLQGDRSAPWLDGLNIPALEVGIGEAVVFCGSPDLERCFTSDAGDECHDIGYLAAVGFGEAASGRDAGMVTGLIWLASSQAAHPDASALAGLVDLAGAAAALVASEQAVMRTGTALLNSEKQSEHFDYVTELAGVGGWEIDPQAETVYWTEQSCRIHDAPPNFAPTLEQWFNLCEDDYRKSQRTAYREAVSTGAGWKMDLPIRTFTGRSIWVASVCQPIFNDDGTVRLVGSIMDVSAKKQAETEIDRSQRLYRSTLNALSEGILVADRDGLLRWHNGAAETIFECNTIYEGMTHLEDIPCVMEHADKVHFTACQHELGDCSLLIALLNSRESFSLTLQIRVGEGLQRKWVRCRSEPLISREDDSFVGLVISVEDITEMKRNEDILNEAFEAIPNGFAVFDQDDCLVMANKAYRGTFMAGKLPSGSEQCTYRDLLESNLKVGRYPDAPEVAEERDAWVESRVSDPFVHAPSHLDRLDDQRWIQTNSMITPSSYRIDYFSNVSEIKKQGAILEAVFEHFPGGVALFDPQYKLSLVNAGMKTLLDIDDDFMKSDITLSAMISRNASREGLSGETLKRAVDRTVARFSQDEIVVYERHLLNGTVHEIKAIPLPDGGLLTTLDDITDRKQMEQRLRDREKRAVEKSAGLENTFANMKQGVSVFDQDGRLQIWNRKYIDIFEKPEDEVRQGVTITEILQGEKDRGHFDADIDEHVRKLRERLKAGEVVRTYFRRKHGRVICCLQSPMPDGGWIGTQDEVGEQDKDYKTYQKMTNVDPLTGLADQTWLLEDVGTAISNLRVKGGASALMVVSIGLANELENGAEAKWEEPLVNIFTHRIHECIRPTDLLARLSDGRFAVLYPKLMNDAEALRSMARRILTFLEEPFVLNGAKQAPLVRIGMVQLSGEAGTAETSLAKACELAEQASDEEQSGYVIGSV